MPISPPLPLPLRIERGSCVVLLAFDVGHSASLDRAEQRLAAGTSRDVIKHRRRAPHHFTYRPAPLRVTRRSRAIPLGPFATDADLECVLYDFGAVSVAYTVPLHGPLDQLVDLGATLYENQTLIDDAREHVRRLMSDVGPAIHRPHLTDHVEDYAVYQIQAFELPLPHGPATSSPDNPASAPQGQLGALLLPHHPLIARILRAEPSELSAQEIDDALSCSLSYGVRDTAYIDWNAAMLIDEDPSDSRAVLEFANIELLEMRNLDDRLDEILDHFYEAAAGPSPGPRAPRPRATPDLHRLAELQSDNALLFEGVNNALKLVGDQYLARLYALAARRFHLPEWDASILRKLGTVQDLYQKLSDRRAARRMEILEIIVILLIALSIAMAFIPGLGH